MPRPTTIHRLVLSSLVIAAACGDDGPAPVDASTPTFTVTIDFDGNGAGEVASTTAGISCTADCTAELELGSSITLTATASAGSTFVGWMGACSGTDTCTVAVGGAETVRAAFALDNELMVVRAGAGTGTVSSAPAGIDCGTDCSEVYAAGTKITLTATPAAQSRFTGWSGEGCTGIGTCVVELDAAQMVTATFSIEQHVLTVLRGGAGDGTVTSTPAGITCGVDCSEAYDAGTMITLVAAPATGSAFAGWSGGGCSGTSTCQVTMTQATAVSATFVEDQYELTVVRAGAGSGTVTSTPAGINCGTNCSEVYAAGSIVTLAATPASGSSFAGWSGGGCSGTGTCQVTMNQVTAVSATFTENRFALVVSRVGMAAATGNVTSNVAGIACGTDCSESYLAGTVVTLTATGGFSGWSGACSGTGACTVTMNGDKAVVANYNCPGPGSTTFSFTGASQTFVVPACVTSINVDARGAIGGNGWNVDNGGSVKGIGGQGGRVQATIPVTPGETLTIVVGGAGQNATTSPGAGGFNGGGDGANSPFGYSGGGGGGASDIRRGAATLSDRIVVAGGGGSGSGWCTAGTGNGGAGGGLVGATGQSCVGGGGTGGTQSVGGTSNGVFGIGGSTGLSGSGSNAGSAGGGGWYGGGAHNGSGGGGGSSFTIAGATNVTHTQGGTTGNGSIAISW